MYQPLPKAAAQTINNFHSTDKERKRSRKSNGDSFLKSFLERHMPTESGGKGNTEDLTYMTRALDNAVVKSKKMVRSTSFKTGSVRKRNVRIRKLSKLDLKPEHQRYESYLPMHKLWQDYMRSIINFESLNDGNVKTYYPHLLKADYHGCLIRVVQSKCPSYVDASGIIIQETKNMFKVITEQNALKSFPKAHSIFNFELDGYRFTIHGNQFRMKSGERVSKKFKGRNLTLDL